MAQEMKRDRELKYPPLPISAEILECARKLKESGQQWEPEVGHFVWDPLEVIESPSPFALRVYFVLNLKRFLEIFGSIDSMRSKLVWVPTFYQLRRIAIQSRHSVNWERGEDPIQEWIYLCRGLLATLQSSSACRGPE